VGARATVGRGAPSALDLSAYRDEVNFLHRQHSWQLRARLRAREGEIRKLTIRSHELERDARRLAGEPAIHSDVPSIRRRTSRVVGGELAEIRARWERHQSGAEPVTDKQVIELAVRKMMLEDQ